MHIRESLLWRGHVRVAVLRRGRWSVEEFANLITDAGRNLLVTALDGVDSEIRYLAWGDDNTAPAAADTTLGNELGRKQITATSNPVGVGNLVTDTYLAPGEANVQIEELGWFAGTGATATADSGVLVARVLYSHLKTNLESIQVSRTDTLT